MNFRSTLLGSAATLFIVSPAYAQEAQAGTADQAAGASATPASASAQQAATATTAQQDTSAAQSVNEDYGDEEAIVVQGTRARGSVICDIPPQNILDSRDGSRRGATSITDLLDALAPQIGSAQGRGGERPSLLRHGRP